jgi:cell division protein FtsB
MQLCSKSSYDKQLPDRGRIGEIDEIKKFQIVEDDMSNKIIYIVGGFFLVVAIIAAVGLGVWGYQLNTRLAATQTQLASLQGDYAKLKADNAQLSTNLSQTNSTLEQTKSDLTKAQSDLKTANSDKAAQLSTINAVKNLMPVVDAIWVTGENDNAITAKVKATGDTKLIDLWDAVLKTPNATTGQAFNEYLFGDLDATVN